MLRRAAAAASAALAAFLIYYFTSPQTLPTDAPDTAVERDEPDIYGEGVTFDQLRPDGTLHYRLNAASIRQYDGAQMTHLRAPKLHLRSVDQPPWDVESEEGFITKKPSADGPVEDQVFLRDQVSMVQVTPRNGTVTLRSDSIYLYPDRQFAHTDDDVIIDTEVGRSKAAGLVVNLATGVLNLSSKPKQRVHTIVLPEQFKKP